MKVLENSHLRAFGNPEKSCDYIFENPGIGILSGILGSLMMTIIGEMLILVVIIVTIQWIFER